MHVGMSTIFQNTDRARTDREVYANELRLADMAEGLGFESVWGVEHHFTDYTMCPDVVQFLTYMAGRTKKAKLGTMVIVLPWHDPIRVAEEVSMLDHISNGRLILGLGRGLGRVEFDGFRVPMDESRARFVEAAQMVLDGLEKGYCEFEGVHYQQPKREIRPEPFQTFRGRTYAAAVSPESTRIMAELGVGLLVIPQKPWPEVEKELADYHAKYEELNNEPPPPPLMAGWTFCDENADRAHEMAYKYIGGYYQTVMDHYEMTAGHFKQTKGYEYYEKVTEKINEYGARDMREFFMNLQIYGTPEQCYERIVSIHNRVGQNGFIGVFSYAGMPYDEAERNMRLFADRVMPELKRFKPEILTPALSA